jgi:transcription elongation factor GreA-like protein
MVNCITIEASITLISKTMDRKNIDELLMVFSAHIYVSREFLCKKIVEYPKSLLDYMMIRNCLLEDITANFKHIKTKNVSLLTAEVRRSGPINFQKQFQNNSYRRMETLGNVM